jgi:hypothetical protein
VRKKARDNKFNIGEKVRVNDKEKILGSLDLANSRDGCLFMSQMWSYCGQEFKVINIIKNVYYKKMLRTRKPLYMLQGIICYGSSEFFGHTCDRRCHLLWHEDWLDGVE